jgi:PAS domain S-box-containing protein
LTQQPPATAPSSRGAVRLASAGSVPPAVQACLDGLAAVGWTVDADGAGGDDAQPIVLATAAVSHAELVAQAAALAAAPLVVVVDGAVDPPLDDALLAAGADEVCAAAGLEPAGLARLLDRAVARRVASERALAAVRDAFARRLGDAEERFARAFTASPLSLTITSLADGRLLDVNETFCRTTGWTREEAVGRTTLELGLWVEPEDRTHELAAVFACGNVKNVEYGFRRRDGSIIWGLLSAERLEVDGEACALTAIADISERKEAEEALLAADRSKDRFIAVLSHELRNPLAPIRNAAAVLAGLAAGDPRLNWCAELIERQSAQMARLLEDLLDASRVKTGRLSIRREPTSLDGVLAQAVETCKPILVAAGHELRWHRRERDPIVAGDPARLAQVFANLLNNAARYSPPGTTIELQVTVAGDAAVVAVRDAGIGIEPGQLPRLFELFATGALAQGGFPARGLGVGLGLARHIVELHGGSIEARSAGRDAGSELLVRLPLAEGPDRPLAPTDELPPLSA